MRNLIQDNEDAESMAAQLAGAIGWHFEAFGGRDVYVSREGATLKVTEYREHSDLVAIEYSATVVVEMRTGDYVDGEA